MYKTFKCTGLGPNHWDFHRSNFETWFNFFPHFNFKREERHKETRGTEKLNDASHARFRPYLARVPNKSNMADDSRPTSSEIIMVSVIKLSKKRERCVWIKRSRVFFLGLHSKRSPTAPESVPKRTCWAKRDRGDVTSCDVLDLRPALRGKGVHGERGWRVAFWIMACHLNLAPGRFDRGKKCEIN